MFRRLGVLIGHVSDIRLYRMAAIAFSVLCFGALEFVVHKGLTRLYAITHTVALIDAALVGSSFGLAVWVLLVANAERRRRIRQDLEQIAELNHEIRNALQVITHSHFDAETKHRRMVLESVARIERVLERVTTVAGG